MAANANLNRAKRVKYDEFYTQLSDIESELHHFSQHFKGKIVYCNCDDPRVSNFFRYFSYNFERLGLKKLIASCYKSTNRDLFSRHDTDKAIWLEYDGNKKGGRVPVCEDIGIREFEGDGSFQNEECIELLKQADIVVTNPPFSLFREYVSQLFEYEKQFLIVGTMSAIVYAEIFPFIRDNKLWVRTKPMTFDVTPEYGAELVSANRSHLIIEGEVKQKLGNSAWFTNLDHKKRHEELILYERYAQDKYPKYDNYDAIEVSKTRTIPMDYDGVMGVPISFLDQYNPDQFEILGSNRGRGQDPNGVYGRGSFLHGKESYKRIFIRNKKAQKQ